MIAREKKALRIVLHDRQVDRAAGARKYDVLRGLLDGGFAVTTVSAASASPGSLAVDDEVLLLHEGGDDPSVESGELAAEDTGLALHVRDIQGRSSEEVLGLAAELSREGDRYENPGWKPWFPVIDYDRCTNCMQCRSFCLFDVYGVDASGGIEVRNEEKCKTNCPACSRVCPEVAILFPKYGAGPINGDVVQKKDVEREKMKVDISALLGGNIYELLRERHAKAASRFSKERDEGKALKERLRCLKALKEELGVPDEVLMALPSVDQIKRKAAEKAREIRDPIEPSESGASPNLS